MLLKLRSLRSEFKTLMSSGTVELNSKMSSVLPLLWVGLNLYCYKSMSIKIKKKIDIIEIRTVERAAVKNWLIKVTSYHKVATASNKLALENDMSC